MNVHAPYIECLGKGNLDLLVGRLEKVTKGCIPQKMVMNTMAQSVKIALNKSKVYMYIYKYIYTYHTRWAPTSHKQGPITLLIGLK